MLGMHRPPLLLAVPNVSEGRDGTAIAAIGAAYAPALLLDTHSDVDHHRSVHTLAARQGEMAVALLSGAREAVARIDLGAHAGVHPRVGALDVAPVVFLTGEDRGAAAAEALTLAGLVGEELEVPVFLYGELATQPGALERATLRAGGAEGLAERLESGALTPDAGPARLHPSAGAVLITARPPLVAFNLELASAGIEAARRIAARLRESGGGPAGVRAIGLELAASGRAQVSVNVHDPDGVPLRRIVELVAAEAEVAEAELVGLAPAAALEGFPAEVPLRGFDPNRHVIEQALRSIE